MPIDPSIALQVKPVEIADPLQNAYKAQLLKSAIGQNDMNMLQQQQLRTTMAQEQGVNSILGTQSNYMDPDKVTNVRRLKPEFETQLASTSHKAFDAYHKDIGEQTETYYKLQEQRSKAQAAESAQAKTLRDEALKLNWGTKSAYENAIAGGKSPEEATAIAEATSQRLYADAIAINPQLAKYPRKPFNYQEANDAVQTLKTYPDYIAENKANKDALATRGEYRVLGNGNYGWFDKAGEKPPFDTNIKAEENWTLAPPAIDPVTQKVVFAKINRGSGEMKLDDTGTPYNKAGDRPLTESERKYTGFYQSMTNASKEIDAVAKKVPRLPFLSLMIEDEPGYMAQIGNAVKRGMMSAEEQRAYTAYRKVISDIQYMTTGFGITATEWPKMWSTYVPLPGDTDDTIKLKARLLKQEIFRAETGGGRGIEQLREREKSTPTAPPPPEIERKRWGADGKVTNVTKGPQEDFSNVQGGSSTTPGAGPYGKREDGTEKGEGYFGTIPRTDGGNQISGELSIGVDINGKETLIPTMVPTLSKPELDFLLSADKNAIFDKKNPMAVGIVEKARAHAEQRIAQGKSVWAEPGEKHPLPVEFPKEMTQHLREGYERDFEVDGEKQTWTLKNGVPTRVR